MYARTIPRILIKIRYLSWRECELLIAEKRLERWWEGAQKRFVAHCHQKSFDVLSTNRQIYNSLKRTDGTSYSHIPDARPLKILLERWAIESPVITSRWKHFSNCFPSFFVVFIATIGEYISVGPLIRIHRARHRERAECLRSHTHILGAHVCGLRSGFWANSTTCIIMLVIKSTNQSPFFL